MISHSDCNPSRLHITSKQAKKLTASLSCFFSKAHAESKVDGLEDQLRRYKTQLEEFARLNQDLNNLKARLTQENFDLHRQVQELESSNGNLAKSKAQLQAQLDEAKARLDEETRVKTCTYWMLIVDWLYMPLFTWTNECSEVHNRF